MKLRTTLTFTLAAIQSVQYFLTGRVRFPGDRLGDVLEMPDSDVFVVYRETAIDHPHAGTPDAGVILVFEVDVTNRTKGAGLREVLFDPFANVATPFFSGMPGFRRKLWLAGERPGEFLELYEWATAEDAERFAAALGSLLKPFEFAGRASFDVVEEGSIEEYVNARGLSWRDRDGPDGGRGEVTGANRWRPVAIGLLLLLVIVVAAVLGMRRPSRLE